VYHTRAHRCPGRRPRPPGRHDATSPEKVVFGFFIGDLDNPVRHDVYELFANVISVVLLIAETIMLRR
jgi:hypothetical protein